MLTKSPPKNNPAITGEFRETWAAGPMTLCLLGKGSPVPTRRRPHAGASIAAAIRARISSTSSSSPSGP